MDYICSPKKLLDSLNKLGLLHSDISHQFSKQDRKYFEEAQNAIISIEKKIPIIRRGLIYYSRRLNEAKIPAKLKSKVKNQIKELSLF